MAKTLDQIFEKEVNDLLRMKGMNPNVTAIPLPNDCMKWEISGKDFYKVDNIPNDTPYFSELNGTLVWKLPKGHKVERRVWSLADHDFKKDEFGQYKTTNIAAQKGSVVVCSKKQLSLPYNFDSKKTKGFNYIDFSIEPGTKEKIYYYIVPKRFMFKVEQIALVLTKRKNMKNYMGVSYKTWDYGKVSLLLIPYKPNIDYVRQSTRVLATGYGETLNEVYAKEFKQKVRKIGDFWIQNRIIGNPQFFDYSELEANMIQEDVEQSFDLEYTGISELSMRDEVLEGELE